MILSTPKIQKYGLNAKLDVSEVYLILNIEIILVYWLCII